MALGYDKGPEGVPGRRVPRAEGVLRGWAGQDGCPGSGRGEGGQGGRAGQDQLGEGSVLLQVQDGSASGAGQGRGHGEDPVPQPLGLPPTRGAVAEGEQLGPCGQL